MKNDKNSKTKITFNATLSKKSSKTLKPERINIQTLIKPKNNSYLLYKQIKTKKFYKQNELSIKDRSRDSSFNSNNSYIYNNKKKIYISGSLSSSFNSTYTSKKRKFKKNEKIKRIKNFFKDKLKISNALESINNIYIHSPNNINQKINKFLLYSRSVSFSHKSRNKNANYSNYSSSCKYDNISRNSDNLDSSETSYNSIEEYKKNKYFSKMIPNEIELDNLTKKEVGIISSDDEENNINSEENNDNYDNNNSLMNNISQEDYSEEIEHILIDIYNKNISIINSQNLGSPFSKKLYETSSIDKKKMKKIFKKHNHEKNLLVLKSLSDKIKCLIEKCKEKIYEIDDINKLYQQYQIDNNNINQKICNSRGSSGLTTNSNSSSYYGSGSDDDNYYLKNNILLNNIQDENFCKDISHDLLTQLVNIKNTLKISSKEIENIFKYAFKSLKTNDGKKAKINIESVLLEQFNKIILNDFLISTLLIQIKFIFSKNKEDYIVKIIDELLQEGLLHNNSMTKFDTLLFQNLSINNDELDKNNNINENKNEIENNNEIKEINNNNILLNDKIKDNNIGKDIKNSPEINNNLCDVGNSSSYDEEIGEEEEENNIINEDRDKNEENNNNNEHINIENNNEKNENNMVENNEKKDEDEDNFRNINFENIDDLIKFINEDSEDKNSNKKHKKKNKKRKKKKNSILVKEKNKYLENNNNKNNININNLSINNYINSEFDDDFIKSFKEDIIKNTIYNGNIIKIKPLIPVNYLFDKCSD